MMTETLRDRLAAIVVSSLMLVCATCAAHGESQPETVAAKPADPTKGAESEAIPIAEEKDPWRAEFNSWAWLMGVYGKLGVRGHVAHVSASFWDVLDKSDSLIAFSGHLEVGYEKVALYVDGFYADIGVNNVHGPDGLESIDITFKQTIVDFGVMYRIGEWEPTPGADKNARKVTLDLYAGARYSGLKLEFDPDEGPGSSGTKDWFDPIVGAKVVVPFDENWHFAFNGDVGGFGAASEFTWSSTVIIGYDFQLFGHPASAMFGYRAIGWEYTDGSGDREFTWDLTEHGAIFGLSLLF